ncbi:MAG: hypothetical protein KDH89_14350, partial [Anaerolineae bacterium]|nr:hypothetical protein [Anaerolineae bacterium]
MDLSFLEQLLGEEVEEQEGYRNVWVVALAWSGKLKESDYQLVGKARDLASSLGAYVHALLLGETASEQLAQELIAYGADTVYFGQGYPTYESLARFFEEKMPEMVLWNSAAGTRKLAPQVAQRTGASLVTHAVDVMLDP